MVPYVQQLVLAQVSVESGVLYPDDHGLLDGPGVAVGLLVHYVELVGVHGMSCGGAVVVYGGSLNQIGTLISKMVTFSTFETPDPVSICTSS